MGGFGVETAGGEVEGPVDGVGALGGLMDGVGALGGLVDGAGAVGGLSLGSTKGERLATAGGAGSGNAALTRASSIGSRRTGC